MTEHIIHFGDRIIPKKKPGRPRTYPLDTLQIGESITVPQEKAASAKACAKRHKKNYYGWDFTTSHTPEGVQIRRTH